MWHVRTESEPGRFYGTDLLNPLDGLSRFCGTDLLNLNGPTESARFCGTDLLNLADFVEDLLNLADL